MLFALLVPAGALCNAQIPEPGTQPETTGQRALPDIPTLMRQVEANERKSEAIQQNYLYDQSGTFDEQKSNGDIKKTDSREFEIFWLNGVRIARLIKQDGRPLSPDELKKEDERIDGIVKKARERRDKADAEGKETDSHGHDEITLARILELGTFSNPRRRTIAGRDTIVVDYLGDPKAKTHNPAEGALKELAGTVWVDEQDQAIQHVEGHFNNDFKVGGGLLINVRKGTWFKATNVKINDEVWLPQSIEGDGHARYLLFFSLNGHFQGHTSGYRKFKATSTILPGLSPVTPDATAPPSPAGTPPEGSGKP